MKEAFEKRGFEVNHNGGVSHAPGGKADIEMFDDEFHFNIETTKATGSSADREYLAIVDHLKNSKIQTNKKCFCIYVSPKTSIRMINQIKMFNSSNDKDLRILPLDFGNINLILDKFAENVVDVYPTNDFINIFNNRFLDFADDQRIKKILSEELFFDDENLKKQIDDEEKEKDLKTLELLIKDLKSIENSLRTKGIATVNNAIDNLIYFVFIKLFEEKREKNGQENRLTLENFRKYKSFNPDADNKGIHKLFKSVKDETNSNDTFIFQEGDTFSERFDDDFVLNDMIPIFEKYPNFIDTKIDILGAVYEVLALRAEKDVKIGQFFTPENVVDFIVKLADLSYEDIILDPACGTGRFLIKSMERMESKLKNSDVRNKDELLTQLKSSQLYGSDIDNRISKLAKMNMWIHGDGKSNIFDHDGLTLEECNVDLFNRGIDVVLTNPPLGNLNYIERYDSRFINNNEILPKINKTQKNFDEQKKRLNRHIEEKEEMLNELKVFEENETIKNIISCENSSSGDSSLKELKKSNEFKEYKKLISKIKRKEKTIENNEHKLRDIEAEILSSNCEFEVTGTSMKGGALFLSSINNYLTSERLPEMFPEWRGGILISVVDEGILNTEDYSNTRKFLRKHFYIKAIISLSKDTFVPISNTSTKTSILFLIKKQDIRAEQQEPIFYAYIDKVGLDTKGKACENHFSEILDKYEEFKNIIFDSYEENRFNKNNFESKMEELNDTE